MRVSAMVGNADYQRTERQRTVLTKMMEKIKDMSLPELYSLLKMFFRW